MKFVCNLITQKNKVENAKNVEKNVKECLLFYIEYKSSIVSFSFINA